MKRTMPARMTWTAAAVLVAGAATAVPAAAGGPVRVTNDHDSGKGSLRHALEVQGAQHVTIAPDVGTIEIDSTLEYTGRKRLTMVGNGQTITSDNNVTLLAVTQGADLEISDLDFVGKPVAYSMTSRGDRNGAASKGIFVDVREDQTGTVRLVLDDVRVSGSANHGIHVSDCSLADECGAGAGGGGTGSAASISVMLENVDIDDVGNGKFDADGIRVDDRGAGSIFFHAYNASFTNVGADGVELDEGGPGDVLAHVAQSRFVDNGGYCDPKLLAAELPSRVEGEFAASAGATVEADVPPKVSGTPDDRCFEREVEYHDSGAVAAYEFGIDVDDGLDYDEAGPGALVATLERSLVRGNLDEGVDLDEGDAGFVRTRFVATDASGNTDDGFKVSELGAGGVVGYVRQSTASNNGGAGFVFEEEADGDVTVSAVHAHSSNNDDGNGTGLEAVQAGAGNGRLRLEGSNIADGITAEGVTQD